MGRSDLTEDADRVARAKRRAAAVSVAAVLAVLFPAHQNWVDLPRDGYPLSYYPMFSSRRGETTSASYIVAFDAKGDRWLLTYGHVAPGGLNQARKILRRMINDQRSDELCRKVAGSVAAQGAKLESVKEVGVATGTFRFDDYFEGKVEPTREEIHAMCPVERGPR